MATIPETQTTAISALAEVLEVLPTRSQKFAGDLVSKGSKWVLSSKQMFYVNKFVKEGEDATSTTGEEGAGKTITTVSTITPSTTENISELCDQLEAVRPHLKSSGQNFAQSLIRQGRSKGFLSAKQLPFVHKMIAEGNDMKGKHASTMASRDAARVAREAAREAHRIATTPVSDSEAMTGFEAVLELFDGAGATLTRTKIHLITDDGQEVVVRSNRRNGESNDVLYIHNHGADYNDRDSQFGHITKSTAGWNFTPATTESVVAVMTQFRNDPIATVSEMGRKSGRCCFCSLPLTDFKSTAHGYGPICAKHYALPYSKTPAMVIEGTIEARVVEVVILRDDEGNYAVKDRSTGETICTFQSRQKANEYADQFSVVEKV